MAWLISNRLMNLLCSQEPVAESLVDTSLAGEQSAPLNGNPIQQAYCAPDKMTVFSRLSRFGMTYKPLTESRGEELLTLYREAFLAKIFHPQEKAQELTENEVECGEKWRASFTKFDPDSRSWKTHQCSLLEDLESFSETWPQWGLMRDGECWEQRTLEQTIRGTGYGLSPDNVSAFHTPNTTGLDGGSNSRKALKKRMENWPTPRSCSAMAATITPESAWNEKRNPNLETIVGQRMWATPTSRDWRGHTITPNFPNGFNKNLVNDVKKFPTPQASDNRDRGNMSNPSIQRRVAKGKQIMLSQSVDPNSGQLNPTWVEWLMGWPLGWTDLKPLAMDKCHFVLQPHGESLEANNA
jgi:DNA (cytosine-5)-methyltransferase 1